MESIGLHQQVKGQQMLVKIISLGSFLALVILGVFSNATDHPGFVLYIFVAILMLTFISLRSIPRIKYLPCPYCDKSVRIREKFRCEYCNHDQKEEKYLPFPCEECGRSLESAICEHCHEEFEL